MTNKYGTGNIQLTNDEIAMEVLRRLENNLVAARSVNRHYEKTFPGGAEGYKKGDTISVKKPNRVKSAEGRTLVVQPMVDQTVPFTINRHRHVGVKFTVRDRMMNINEFSDKVIKAPAAELAHHLDYSILDCAVKTSFWTQGTPNQNLTHANVIRAGADATMIGHPNDSQTRVLLNPIDAAEHQIKLTTLNAPGLVEKAVERDYLGNIGGYDTFKTAQMPMHQVGVATGTPKVNGNHSGGNTLITKGWTNNTPKILRAGDVIEIAGVYAINPASYQSTGKLQQFVLTEDADAGASTGPATLKLSPPMNDGTATDVDGEGNTISLAAYQNVTAYPQDDAEITVIGAGGSVRRENLFLHKDAITLAVVPGYLPQTAPFAKMVRHEKSGLSLTMTGQYSINDHEEVFRIDLIWGVANLYPELSRRIFGTN